LIRSTSATEVPPNFCTMRAMLLSEIYPGKRREAPATILPVTGATTYSFPVYRAIELSRSTERIRILHETGATIGPEEIGRFAAQAGTWWDPEGSFRPLHRLNPTRLGFIRQHLLAHFGRNPSSLRPFEGLTLLDIGCGGGLVAEPMARLGFTVTGIDADAEAISIARAHARALGLAIDYRIATAESVADTDQRFDAVLALEIIEHVADPVVFLGCVGVLARQGGALIGATLNRTARSFALAIIGAEYVFGWLPRGTHDWRKFLRPSEFVLGLRRNGFRATHLAGVSYDLIRGEWSLSRDLAINYMVMAVRR
jgi:2-polyprenyl-6-hydroxyphenyl methylase/3-demethylubiquinone-9 3-methyltransferase